MPEILSKKRVLSTLVSLMLLCPLAAFAASSLSIDGSDPYTEAASGTGSGGGSWEWGGPEGDLTLTDFHGDSIRATGDLTVHVNGENSVNEINVTFEPGDQRDGGNLDLIGEGDDASLTIGDGTQPEMDNGDFTPIPITSGSVNAFDGISIENLDVDLANASLSSGGSLTVIDSEIDGFSSSSLTSPIHVNTNGRAIGTDGYYLKIDNSHLHVYSKNDLTEEEYRDEYKRYYYSGLKIFKTDEIFDLVREDLLSEYGVGGEDIDFEAFMDDYPAIRELLDTYGVEAPPTIEWSDLGQINGLEEYSMSPRGQKLIMDSGYFIFNNVEGDIYPVVTWWSEKGNWMALVGEDRFTKDVEIEPKKPEPEPTPMPTPEPEPTPGEKTTTRTLLPQTGDPVLFVSAAITASSACAAVALGLHRRRED